MIKVKWHQSIQFKLQLYICLIFIICVGSILIHDYRTSISDLEISLLEDMKNNYSQVMEHIDNATLRAVSLSSWVANSKNIQEVFARKDRDQLKEITLPIYEEAKKTANFDKFQFHLPPATSFLRLHKLEKFGDDLSKIRPTIVAVNSTKKNVQGLDRGTFGFGIRGLSPIFHDNKHIGSVEFGVGLNDQFLQRLKDLYNTSAAVVIDADGGYKVLAKNFEFGNPESFYDTYDSVLNDGTQKMMMRDVDGHHIYSFVGALKDFSGKIEGAVVIEKDVSDKVNALQKMLVYYILAALLSGAVIAFVVFLIIKRLLQDRIKKFSRVFRDASRGDLTARSRVLKPDEMGMLGQMLNEFTGSLQSDIKSISTDAVELHNASTNMDSVARELSEETDQSEKTIVSVATNAEKTSQDMNAVAAAMEELSTNTRQIASATSSMSETIKDISRNTEHASEISGSAVTKVESASSRVDELGEAAQKIGQVSDTINDISEQTNLLALNATIEAARAGEAGKGFAVVAGEIKSLAQQTAQATDKIKESIAWIQNSTKSTVNDIKDVVKVINDVNKIVKNISQAVDQQTKTIAEIDDNVSQGASAIQEVSVNVANASSASNETSKNVKTVSKSISHISYNSTGIASSARQLSGLAGKLNTLVGKFKVE
jgi:methyl-accepting chemotaxis protein